MRDLPRLKAAYDWATREFDQQVRAAMLAGNPQTINQLEEISDAVERGMFVLMFAQFEVELTQGFERRLAERRAHQQKFLTRLGLMLEKDGAAYRKVVAAYGQRNDCAHGGTTAPVGSIDRLVEDLYEWQAELRRA